MRRLILAAVSAAALAAGAADAATYVFVGSWQVDEGPSWTVVPPAYTGQEAAALLFGGVASDYAISTVDTNPANIDFQSWVSVWGAGGFADCPGFPCGRKVPQGVVTSTGGLYQNPGDESAYVFDWAVGPEFTNYAFKAVIPEPGTWAMLIAGFGLVGWASRRRATTVTA
jgi:hypothetical protein